VNFCVYAVSCWNVMARWRTQAVATIMDMSSAVRRESQLVDRGLGFET
jgi:hypothetical protein